VSTEFTSETIAAGVARWCVPHLTVRDAAVLWRDDVEFRASMTQVLKSSTAVAYRWEMPAVDRSTSGRPFEFVLVASPSLDRPANPSAFSAKMREAEEDIVVFENLGGDSILVVPTPSSSHDHYPHMAAFMRGAPAAQIDRLWQKVGSQLLARIGDRPVWLSTAGGGVPWLHVRLDDRPKYYSYAPYRALPV